jgi:hypothetical protein
MDLIEKYLGEKKKRIKNPDHAAMKQKKVSRIPTAPPTEFHKDKSKYSRRKKHKNKGEY